MRCCQSACMFSADTSVVRFSRHIGRGGSGARFSLPVFSRHNGRKVQQPAGQRCCPARTAGITQARVLVCTLHRAAIAIVYRHCLPDRLTDVSSGMFTDITDGLSQLAVPMPYLAGDMTNINRQPSRDPACTGLARTRDSAMQYSAACIIVDGSRMR